MTDEDSSNDGSGYAFDETHDAALARHAALTTLTLDDRLRRLDQISHGDMAGWDVWDVGTGTGALTAHLASRVGGTGHVLATDRRLDLFTARGTIDAIDAQVHDITADPLPDKQFDLITMTNVLSHLPRRHAVILKLSKALKPGGVLYAEDWRASDNPADMLLFDGEGDCSEAFLHVQTVFLNVLEAHGHDRHWPTHAYAVMTEAGLRRVTTGATQRLWGGGGAGCRFLAAGIRQTILALIDRDVPADQINSALAMLNHPDTAIMGHPAHWTIGRKPQGNAEDSAEV